MNDGGPAFPTISSIDADKVQRHGMFCHDVNGETGMSLRDWFAGMSLMGMQAACNQQTRELLLNQGNSTEMFAVSAYAMADMMLVKR